MPNKAKKKSRYINTTEKKKVDKSSNLKCAWCGTTLMERHHITPYSEGGQNDSENLILLCPNCHTLVHQGKVSTQELYNRRKKLTGEVDRSSGSLSLTKEYIFKLGGNTFTSTPNIIKHNGEVLLSIKNENSNLLISLRLYDKKRNLICWMEDNKWWVENEEIFNFTYSKKSFEVKTKDQEIEIRIEIEEDVINVQGCLYLNGYLLMFDKENIIYIKKSYPLSYTQVKGNVFDSCNCAIGIDT